MSPADQHNKTTTQLGSELEELRVQLRKLDPQLENKYSETLNEIDLIIQNPKYILDDGSIAIPDPARKMMRDADAISKMIADGKINPLRNNDQKDRQT